MNHLSLIDALKLASKYVDRTAGTALGIAMSGDEHPNPDEVLMTLAEDGLALSPKLHAALIAAEKATSAPR